MCGSSNLPPGLSSRRLLDEEKGFPLPGRNTAWKTRKCAGFVFAGGTRSGFSGAVSFPLKRNDSDLKIFSCGCVLNTTRFARERE